MTGVDILTDTGSYRSTYDILLDISKVWKDISDVDQAALLEIIAGKTRSNTAAAILSNTKDLEEALLAAQEAEGSALRENEKYLDSIQGKIDQFNNAVQTMWSNTLDDDMVKGVVELGTELVKIVDNFGLIKTLVMAIGTFLIQKNFKGDLFGGLFSTQNLEDARVKLQSLKAEYEKAQQAYDANHTGANKRYLDSTKKTYEKYDGKVSPLIKEYDKLTDKLSKLKEQRQALVNDMSNSQAHEDFLGKKMAAGYDVSAKSIDNARASTTRLNGQIQQVDQEITNTEVALQNVQRQAQQTGIAGATAGQKIKAGFKSAKTEIVKFGKQMLSSMAYMYVFTTIFELFTKFGHWIENWIDGWVETQEEAQEAFEELNNELSKTKSEIRNLEGQLETANERIEELMDQGTLTFVEQEELDKLKATTQELERQISLQETLKKSQQQGVNAASINATNKYLDTSFMSDKTKTERQEEAKENWSTWGKIAGAALGAALIGLGVLGEGVTFGTSTGLIVLGASMMAGGALGGAAGSAYAGAAYDSEQSVGEAMDSMLTTRAQLKQTQDDALADNDVKAYNEATEALRTYDEQMAKHISQIQENYNAMDWETASPADKQYMKDMADWLDAYSISMGTTGAKSNAIARIFGDEAEGGFAQAKKEVDALKKNLTEAKKNGEGVDEALAALEGFQLNLSEEEVERLRAMGIYLYEVEDYFKNVVETESEFIDSDLEDVAKDINKITDGLGSLKSAFEEVIDEGVLTAKTIMSLKEELELSKYADVEGVTDAWREYLDIMMSGTATTEEMTVATEQLAQSIIEAALANGQLTPDNKGEYIAQLRSLGITNAEEYVDDLLQKNMVKEIESSDAYTEALKRAFEEETRYQIPTEKFDEVFDNLTAEQLSELANKYNVAAKLDADTVDKLAEKYGIAAENVQKIIDKLSEKQKLENDISAIKEQQEAYDEFSNLWGEKLQDYNSLGKKIKDTYGTFTYEEQDFDKGQWKANADYSKYQNKTTGAWITKDEYNALLKRNQEYQKMLSSDTYQEWKKLHDELYDMQQSEEGKQWLNDDLTLKPGVDADFEKQVNQLKDKIANIDKEIDKELTVDVKLQLELQNKSELVDDIQSVFDTLVNAQKEYTEKGYVSVDTLQTLLQLEPKYLDLLVDEKGNLNLTKDALYNVARARITDMGIQSQKNILEQATALASKGSSEALREQIEVMQNANEVGADFVAVQMAKIQAILDERVAAKELTRAEADAFVKGTMNQIQAVQVATKSALDNLENSLSSSGNTATAEVEDAFQKAMDYWENRIGANRSLYEQIQNDIDLLEKKGQIAGESYYQAQMAVENERLQHLQAQRDEARGYLDDFAVGSDKWWEVANTLNDIENEIDDVTLSLQDLKDAMDQVHWTIFDEAHERMDDLQTQLSNVREILSADEDSFFTDEGEWTETGVAVLGTYIQEIELYKSALSDVKKELAELDINDFDSEQEYYDKLTELTNKQHDYTKAISDSEQSVVDMYESSVDAVEEYTQTLVESYNDYIDVVKEALDAERDLYDFKKNVQKQSKDIAEIERRIVSLSGSTNKADIAERRKLEAQLYESRESLNDTYYDHAKESQQQALDDEREAYEENMNKFVEGLRTSLEEATANMDEFLMSVTSMVTRNAETVLNKYESTELPLSTALTNPWEAAKKASNTYSGNALDLMNQWTREGGFFAQFNSVGTNNLTSPWGAGKTAASNFASSVQSSMSSVYTSIQSNVRDSVTQLNALKTKYQEIIDTAAQATTVGGNTGGGNTGGGNTSANQTVTATLNSSGKKFSSTITAKTVTEAQKIAKDAVIQMAYDYYHSQGYDDAWLDRKYSSWSKAVTYHAKGTFGTKRDEWAITDEPQFGDELVLVPGKDGNLSFMRKGTSVVPAEITTNLMEWGQFTPDAMSLGGGVNVNMINNSVMKPQYDLSFDSLVHVDNCSQETLKDLEKMVDNKIDRFSKELNYSIKRFAR